MPDHYQAPWWLPGGHLQTIYPFLFARRPNMAYRRERWDTPDGDFIDIDWLDGPDSAPLVVLFHGLESHSRSHYALSLMAAWQRVGWRGAVVHFRGCSGEANRLPRAYHSGDSAEIDWILRRFRQIASTPPLFTTGVSLGGNALLKWLGEQGAAATAIVTAAAAISVPLDLPLAGATLDRGFNRRTYTAHFLHSLKRKVHAKIRLQQLDLDPARLGKVRSLREFDDLYTAPMHGFRDAAAYWQHASCKPLLRQVQVPTLLIHARNDPFLPASALPVAGEISSSVKLEFTAEGGHAGFISPPFPGSLTWLPRRLLDFFTSHDEKLEGTRKNLHNPPEDRTKQE